MSEKNTTFSMDTKPLAAAIIVTSCMWALVNIAKSGKN